MAHVAEIDENGIVLRVIVVDNALADPEAWAANWSGIPLASWKKTSYNTIG
jgi:hypothetical protein